MRPVALTPEVAMIGLMTLVAALSPASVPAAIRGFPIGRITITEAGRWAPNRYGDETRQHCALFRPSADDVRRWFVGARRVSKSFWLERTEWTQCSAIGTVASRGVAYRWILDPSGRGSVTSPRGEDIFLAGPELRVPTKRN